MQYKRNESFRYTFTEPCKATFRLIKDANGLTEKEISKKGICEIIDISPHGLKIFTEYSIAIDKQIHVELNFTLDESPIDLVGEFVWSRRKINGSEYGINLPGDTYTEQLIIRELKNLGRKSMNMRK
ncbi:PilZ domain-containing protein [Psychrobacillus sp. OK032]|uniref:PilZ domain-containing protein n=1 Tax=Psychrobacillus sp. OK032 TaxID=1884358 RepID=UPI0008D115B4|nr:PilZ domain-containing protein [Psychrobacillus sp. OK032]SER64539.1 PilZ domain-containing protein [Psychrobacillus sp. OK032]